MTIAGRWGCRVLLALLVLAPLAAPGPAQADADAVRRAEQRFLATRDTADLLETYRANARHVAPNRMAFATWAAGASFERGGEGPLVAAVAALRRGELSPARRYVARAEAETPGVEATWLGALVRTRSDDDAGAKGRLMAPPLFHWDGL